MRSQDQPLLNTRSIGELDVGDTQSSNCWKV